MYIRKVKVPSSNGNINEYVRVVEAYRQDGKVKQRTVADLGRVDLLRELLPKLQRLLLGQDALDEQLSDQCDILDASTFGPVRVVQALFEQLDLWNILDQHLGQARGEVDFADRVFVLLANRLIQPKSEHGLAFWLETDFVCDRQGRRFVPQWRQRGRVRVHHQQLEAWYRTLDQLIDAKPVLEKALFHRLRDLFHLKVDLALYDLTSTYFEGAGDRNLAKHGYSRDGKSKNVQVLVGVVMVAGWPIAHHVFAGNRKDASTVPDVVKDLKERFGIGRVVFVGDRGMVSEESLQSLDNADYGYILGVQRRRNPELIRWLESVDETKWIDCPLGINAQEKKTKPPKTRVQEVASGEVGKRVFVIQSDERREYEQAMRERSMEKTREALEKVQQRVASGKLKDASKVGASAARALARSHGSRYYDWRFENGAFEYFEHPVNLAREKRLEGMYVIATSESDLSALEAVGHYKDLMEVERGFRHLKDVLEMRPIYHRCGPRISGHLFVATLALLLERLLESRLRASGLDLSASSALEALSTIRLVSFRLPSGGTRRGVSRGSHHAQRVLKALRIEQVKPPMPPAGSETIM